MRRAVLLTVLVLTLLVPATASAAFHLMKVSEVGNANPADYVELQMYAPGQNFVAGHYVRVYDDAGAERSTFQIPANVAQGGDQRTILLGRDEAVAWPVQPDFTGDVVIGADGAVCFLDSLVLPPIDCVSFGTFTPATPLPAGTPAPALAPGGITLQRTIARGCPTSLEAADDTDDSAADFALLPATPRNNATAPTERACDEAPPETTIDKQPKKRTTKRRAKLVFSSSETGSTFECKLDGGAFKPCESPFRKRVGIGRHRFSVVATDAAGNRDATPAKARFKRIARD